MNHQDAKTDLLITTVVIPGTEQGVCKCLNADQGAETALRGSLALKSKSFALVSYLLQLRATYYRPSLMAQHIYISTCIGLDLVGA